jgi:MFS family permease
MTAGKRDSEEADQRAEPVRPWGALSFRDFRFFWVYGLTGGISRSMREMLTFYYVYELSASAVQLGLTGLFSVTPTLLLGLYGGALADSLNRKTLLMLSQAANLAAAIVLTIIVFLDAVEVWHLWAGTAFWSATSILGRPAQRSYLPRLVPESHLVNAITWNTILSQGTLFVGPLVAGFLIWAVGIEYAYLTNAAVVFMGIGAIAAIRTSGAQEVSGRKASLRTIWEGVQFVRFQQVLLAEFLMDFGVMAVGAVRPIMPILAKDVYEVGPLGLGVLNSAPAVGAIVGAAIMLAVGDFRRKGVVVVLGFGGYALSVMLLGLSSWFLTATVAFALGLGALAMLGFMDVVSLTAKQSLLQIVAPDAFRGRASSLSSILSNLGNGTGAVEMGNMAAIIGAQPTLFVSGLIGMCIATAISLRWPALWRWGAAPAAEVEEEVAST